MPSDRDIAQLMLEVGRAKAAGNLGAAQAWSGALDRIGQTVAQVPQIIEGAKQAADQQRARDARSAFSAAMKQTPMLNQDGLSMYDVGAIGKVMTDAGFGAEFAPAAQHLDQINQSMSQFQSSRLNLLKTGATALLQSGADPALTKNFLDGLKTNKVYPDAMIDEWEQRIADKPEVAKAVLGYLAGPQKTEKLGPGDVLVGGITGQPIASAPFKPGEGQHVVNGQIVGPDGQPIGTAIPKQETPSEVSARAETARHNLAMEAISKLNAGREAAAQAETARHNKAMEAANNPLAALTASGANGQPTGAEPPRLQGEELLKSLPEGVQTTVKALAEGRMAFPYGFALKTPYWQSMINLVGQYDPTFDAVNYNARASTRKAFTSGKEAQQVNALNTVLGHLDKLSDAAEQLGNSDVQALNSIKNWASKQFGSSAVTNFDTVKKAVAYEVTRVWRQAGGSVEDIRAAQENLKASNSPDQLRGAIATYGDLLKSKLESLQDQYKQGMGTSDVSMLRPESEAVLDKISKRAAGVSIPSSAEKKLTVSELNEIARRMGKTYAEAMKDAESRGYVIVR